jgi:hypothetical protein
MHQYSTDITRWQIIAAIGAVSLVLTIVVNPVLERFLPSGPVGRNAPSLTVLTITTVLYQFYRRVLWLPVGRFLDTQVPNLNGQWVLTEDTGGTLSKTADQDSKLLIKQDWTKIQIDYFDQYKVYLRSNSAKVSTLGPNNPEITFTCEGEIPEEDGQNYKNIEGTFRLRFVRAEGEERLVGRYYDNLDGSSSSMVEFRLDSDKFFRRLHRKESK